MTLTYSLLCLACVVVGVIGHVVWLRWRHPGGQFSVWQDMPSGIKMHADRLTEEEAARFIERMQAARIERKSEWMT